MPKIPMMNKGTIQHVRAESPMTGAGQRLHYYGGDGTAEALAKAGDKMTQAIFGVGQSMLQYQEKMQDADNKLAAAEARNLYRTINAELDERMSANPADFDKFKDWALEADKKYADGAAEFTSRMSDGYREQFEAEMAGLRIESTHRRTRIGIQAKVTADYNLFQSQWKDAAIRGDLKECNRLLEEQRGNLINEAEYQQKKLDYNRLAEFGAVKLAVEGNVPGIIEQLKARNEDGAYKHFANLDVGKREQLIRIAEAQDARRRADENEALIDQLSSGATVSLEDIERKFEGKTSPADLRQKREQRQIVQKVLHSRAGYKAKATEEQRKREFESFRWKIYDFKFSEVPEVRSKEFDQLRNEILAAYPAEGGKRMQLMEELKANYQSVVKPDASYKHSYIYLRANALLEGMKGDFYSRYPGRGESWYSFATDVYDDSKGLKQNNYQMAQRHLDEFIRKNPNATEKDVRDFLDKLKRDVNWTECDKLVEFWEQRSVPRVQNSRWTSEEIDRMVNGRRGILASGGIERIGTDKQGRKWIVRDGKVIKPLDER